MIRILPATVAHAEPITRLIMMAMSDDCCQYFAGPEHTLADFAHLMQSLVEAEQTQYSYQNTLVAVDEGGRVVGACVAYDGSKLHALREAFIRGARAMLQRDFRGMDDETGTGEYYVDSLAVEPAHRGQGIAARLLLAMAERAADLPLGLLVDVDNPHAEQLYTRVGFRYVGDSHWGGHPMRHLVRPSGQAKGEA